MVMDARETAFAISPRSIFLAAAVQSITHLPQNQGAETPDQHLYHDHKLVAHQ